MQHRRSFVSIRSKNQASTGQSCHRATKQPAHSVGSTSRGQNLAVPKESAPFNEVRKSDTSHAVTLGRATGRAIVVPNASYIQTWHIFDIVEPLARGANNESGCNLDLPSAVSLNGTQVAFPFTQGAVTSRGVTVSMVTPHSDISFKAGQRFVLFTQECGRGAVLLPFGIAAAIPVSDDQRLKIDGPEQEFPQYRQRPEESRDG